MTATRRAVDEQSSPAFHSDKRTSIGIGINLWACRVGCIGRYLPMSASVLMPMVDRNVAQAAEPEFVGAAADICIAEIECHAGGSLLGDEAGDPIVEHAARPGGIGPWWTTSH